MTEIAGCDEQAGVEGRVHNALMLPIVTLIVKTTQASCGDASSWQSAALFLLESVVAGCVLVLAKSSSEARTAVLARLVQGVSGRLDDASKSEGAPPMTKQ